jgi:H+-translocating NAD(P) transhydrogenase
VEAGGNIETTVPGSIWVFLSGVTCIGYTDLPSRLATQASTLYSNNKINAGLAARNLVAGGVFLATGNPAIGASCLAASTAMSGVLGVQMTASIEAADLAVVFILLNAYSELALAAEGVLLDNDLLTIVGALIALSGSVLSYIMCTALNRSLSNVILGAVRECSKLIVQGAASGGNCAFTIHHFCSRDQLAEGRDAINCDDKN